MEITLMAGNGIAESDLVRRARTGDREAFASLVETYKRRTYFTALALVGSHEDALDLSQEAFARAFRARATLDPERPFYVWLYTILRRLCFNFIRDRANRGRRLEEARDWLVHEAACRAEADDPAHRAEMDELRDRLRVAIETLPDHEREVLVLKEFEGLRYREIAELVDIPIGTVMSRLYSARQRLARSMETER
jgi:RNA polymerase sigma-70 factor (ECF subfamily)